MGSNDESNRDLILIERLKGGDARALDLLLRIHWVNLNRYARTLVQSEDLAQDVVQEVFLRLWKYRDSITLHSGVSFYLYRMTRNQAMATLSSRRAAMEREGRWISEYRSFSTELNTAINVLDGEDILRYIETSIEPLPQRCREIFLLSWQHNMTYSDIAEMLDISVATVRNQMSRAVKHLATVVSVTDLGSGKVQIKKSSLPM